MVLKKADITLILASVAVLCGVQIYIYDALSQKIIDARFMVSKQIARTQFDVSQVKNDLELSKEVLSREIHALRDDLVRWDVMALGTVGGHQPNDETKSFDYYKTSAWSKTMTDYVEKNSRRFLHRGTAADGFFDGGGGVDTLVNFSHKILFLNELNFRSIEKLNLVDGKENKVVVTIPGLNFLENNEMEIIGDRGLDSVLLDGCLNWKIVNVKEGEERRFEATDSKGSVRFVNIVGGVSVEIEESCTQDYITRFLIANAINTINSFDVKRQREASDEAINYRINDKVNLHIYKEWLEGIQDPLVKARMSFLVKLMESGELPTEFPRSVMHSGGKSLMQMLDFAPQKMQATGVQDKGNCNTENNKPMVVVHQTDSAKVDCRKNNQIYIFSDENDALHDAQGNDIVFPGKGDDLLHLDVGEDIVILDKGWGHKTIYKSCAHSKVKSHLLYSDYRFRSIFMGVGISYRKDNDSLYVRQVMPDGVAEKAGLEQGDRIYSIDGVDVSSMSDFEVLTAFRDGDHSYVSLEYLDYSKNMTNNIRVEKKIVNAPAGDIKGAMLDFDKKGHAFQKIRYKWPFKYTNLIVFSDGVTENDMKWVGPNVLKNQATGDDITFIGNPCFDFVYSKHSNDNPSGDDTVTPQN